MLCSARLLRTTANLSCELTLQKTCGTAYMPTCHLAPPDSACPLPPCRSLARATQPA
jgi:hypothetical protein